MATTATETPVFEVERFAVAGDRLEIEGHWSGVRGLRFVRPTLTLVDGDDRRRLLATLDGRPWSPDVPTWRASFPWDGGELVAETAELALGPSVVVDLPAPGGSPRRKPRSDAGRFATAGGEARDALISSRDAAAAERDVLRAELAEVTAERDRLREELAGARGSGDAEKDRAHRALTELAAERDELRRDRDAARHALASAEADRDDARRRLAGVEAQRDEARERVRKVEAQRDEARAERDAARRDAPRPAVDDADAAAGVKRARDAAVERATLLQAQLTAALAARDEAIRDRDAALRARPAAPAATPAPLPLSARTQRETPSVGDSWLIRMTATLAMVVVLVVAALLFT